MIALTFRLTVLRSIPFPAGDTSDPIHCCKSCEEISCTFLFLRYKDSARTSPQYILAVFDAYFSVRNAWNATNVCMTLLSPVGATAFNICGDAFFENVL